MVRTVNQILQLKVDTGKPVSFSNWTTTKEIIDRSRKPKLILAEKLNLAAQFVDYNKQPILISGALKTDRRSAGWEVKGANFLVTERRTRWILGLDLRCQVGISTIQRPAPRGLSRFGVLLCVQSEGLEIKFLQQFKDLFNRQEISENHIKSSEFKQFLCPIHETGKKTPIHISD